MKLNPDNPYIQKFYNYDYEKWDDEIIKNNPSCIHHLIELVKNNPDSLNQMIFTKANLLFQSWNPEFKH